MRKIILVTAMVLVSASAQAGGQRSLSLSAVSEPASVQQTAPALAAAPTQVSEAAAAAEAPKYLDRPPAVSLTPPAATATPTTTTILVAVIGRYSQRSEVATNYVAVIHRSAESWAAALDAAAPCLADLR